MTAVSEGDAAKAVVRLNADVIQSRGDWALFDKLWADDFVDHTPQQGVPADKAGVLQLYKGLRAAFPDFQAEIGWQTVEGDLVTSYKIYHGTHLGSILGVEPTGRKVSFEAVDAMRVRGGKIVDHWGAANLLSLLGQLTNEPNSVVPDRSEGV
jgi:predicted ester cyclase